MANAAPAESAPAAAPEGPKGPKPILMYLLVLVNMAAVVGVGVMIHMKNQADKKKATIDSVIEGEAQTKAEEDKHVEDTTGKTIPLETFLVNLAGSRGQNLLKVDLEFEVDGDAVLKEIEKRKPQIRDIVIILLSSKTYKEIESAEGKNALRDEIRDRVNAFLTKGKIKRVLFTNIITNR